MKSIIDLQTRYGLLIVVLVFAWAAIFSGCSARYVTPGAAVNLQSISEYDIKERFETKPAAPFPARIALVRVQDSDYYSYTSRGYGKGRFSLVTTRDVEKDEHFEKIARLPQISGLGTINRLLVSEHLESIKDLRLACASIHADLLLVYTFDTGFRIKDHDVGPLAVISLGFLPNRQAFVTTTASSALYDVRTGYVFGLAETSHTTSHLASAWSESNIVDNARLETEKIAFAKLVDEFCKIWPGILQEYSIKKTSPSTETIKYEK